MVAALINEEAVFILGQTILKPRMRKIPKEGVGTVNKSPWEKSFNEDWQIIRLNWNLFECKSPLTAGKGSSSPPSFGQEWSKRNCKTARSAVSGLGRGAEKGIAMWELSI